MYRSLSAKALGLRQGEVFTVLMKGGTVTVLRGSGEANPMVAAAVVDAVAYTPEGQLRVRHDSLVYRAGCQVRIKS
jgi:hypothetical protein